MRKSKTMVHVLSTSPVWSHMAYGLACVWFDFNTGDHFLVLKEGRYLSCSSFLGFGKHWFPGVHSGLRIYAFIHAFMPYTTIVCSSCVLLACMCWETYNYIAWYPYLILYIYIAKYHIIYMDSLCVPTDRNEYWVLVDSIFSSACANDMDVSYIQMYNIRLEVSYDD